MPPDLGPRHRRVLGLVALGSMLVAFTNTLFTQTVAYAAVEFGISNSAQGLGSAVVRWGIIISLPIVALADSRGRRPMIVATAWAAPLVCALGAFAPSFPALVTFAWPPVLVAVSVNVSPLSDAVSLITAVRTSSVVPLTGIAT